MLLVDASNAFNSLSHTAMLLNAHFLGFRHSHFLFNTYGGWSVLVLQGSCDFFIVKVSRREIHCQCLCMPLGHCL